jgi:peptidoglycan/LPS O-acetylase OafA/YrhL
MGHLLILVVLDRVLSPAQKHDAAQASHWLGLAYVILAVFLVLVVSQFTYQWIERPYQKKFQNQAANWFKN